MPTCITSVFIHSVCKQCVGLTLSHEGSLEAAMTLTSVNVFEFKLFPPGDTPHSPCLGSKCIVHILNRQGCMLKKASTGDGFWLINFLNVFFFPLMAARDRPQNLVFLTVFSRSVHGRLELSDERTLLETAAVMSRIFKEEYLYLLRRGSGHLPHSRLVVASRVQCFSTSVFA